MKYYKYNNVLQVGIPINLRIHRGKYILNPKLNFHSCIHLHPEVKEALSLGRPVVALESTIISHGMPYPRNLDVAHKLEQTIRSAGAIPATVAIIGGFAKIGLDSSELSLLAGSTGTSPFIKKASRRDIAYCLAKGEHAATTVAGTMILAHMAGIKVFATGGIGGVHRGGEESMDVSADLHELSRTPVTVVSAGVKSILDIPRTLEVLETLGVPVLGFKCTKFPSFFTTDSGCDAPLSVASAAEVARIMSAAESMGILSGMLVAVPPPMPVDKDAVDEAIDQALREASRQSVRGAAITPFLLSAIQRITAGNSLESNIALVLQNARVAADIAIEFSSLHRLVAPVAAIPLRMTATEFLSPTKTEFVDAVIDVIDVDATALSSNSEESLPVPRSESEILSPAVVVVGAATVDYIASPHPPPGPPLIPGSSSPGRMRSSFGGVGRNIADSLARLSVSDVLLLTAVGQDGPGRAILADAAEKQFHIWPCPSDSQEMEGTHDESMATATYTAIHQQNGELLAAIADVDILKRMTAESIQLSFVSILEKCKLSGQSPLVVCDGNLTVSAFAALAQLCTSTQPPLSLVFEPTSDAKCTLPLLAGAMHQVDIVTPNLSELVVMASHWLDAGLVVNQASMAKSLINRIRQIRTEDSNGSSGMTKRPIALSDVAVLAGIVLEAMRHVRGPRSGSGPGPKTSELGKHVVVTMGREGVLWLGPKKCFVAGAEARASGLVNGGVVVVQRDEATSWMHIPAPTIPTHRLTNTSGAGDALVAGLVASLLRSGKRSRHLQPVDLFAGVKAAEIHLLRSLGSETETARTSTPSTSSV
eukprot:gene2722-5361_t